LIETFDRIIDARVILTLLRATTVQLGEVIHTMTRASFLTMSLSS